MNRYSYFPGCSTESTAKPGELATQYVMNQLGIDLIEIDDWNCCGATSGHTISDELGLALPARSLARAEKDYPDLDIVTGCASCYARLKLAAYKVRNDARKKYMVEHIIKQPYEAKREVLSFLDILDTDEMRERIKESIVRKYENLNVACYYGCLNVRPSEVTGVKDRENPQTMDRIAALTGANPIDWSCKSECCGAAHHVDAASQTRSLVWRILDNARSNSADLILTACPMCTMNLEMRQDEYVKKAGGEKIPAISVMELLAIAMGAGGKALELGSHYVPVGRLLKTALMGQESEVITI